MSKSAIILSDLSLLFRLCRRSKKIMPKTLVQTSHGMVQGVQVGTIASWKGIPYAQPPLGARRFRPPQPLEAWPDVLQATQFGPMAMQPPSMPAELLRR